MAKQYNNNVNIYQIYCFGRAKANQELLAAAIMELLEPLTLDLYLSLAVAAELGISIGKRSVCPSVIIWIKCDLIG